VDWENPNCSHEPFEGGHAGADKPMAPELAGGVVNHQFPATGLVAGGANALMISIRENSTLPSRIHLDNRVEYKRLFVFPMTARHAISSLDNARGTIQYHRQASQFHLKSERLC